MSAVTDRLKKTAAGKSEEFKKWSHDMRAKVYGGCAACIIQPATCPICYGTAAAILETNIAKYKRETEFFVKDFNSWADSFTVLSTMAKQASTVSKSWYIKIVDFKNTIQATLDFVS